MPRFALLFLAAVLGCRAETVSVNIGRQVQVAPSAVVFQLVVALPSATTISDAVAVVAPLGVTAANFAMGEYDRSVGSDDRFWYRFDLSSPYDRVQATVTRLADFCRRTPGVTFHVSEVINDVAPIDPAVYAEMFAEGRRRAEVIAAAAGVTLGRPIAMEDRFNVSSGPIGIGGNWSGPGVIWNAQVALKTTYILSVTFAAQ